MRNRHQNRKGGGVVKWIMLFLFCCVAMWLCVVIMHMNPNSLKTSQLRQEQNINVPTVNTVATVITKQETLTKKADSDIDESYQIVFSTGCSEFQDWQSIGVYSSADAIGQKGVITRIASGCKPEQEAAIRHAMSHLPKRCRVHFAPGTQVKDHYGHNYKYANKPLGMMHWLMHSGKYICTFTHHI
jgi:hypothetical protein